MERRSDPVVAAAAPPQRFGYPLEEARSFTNDGRREALIPGKTNFGYWQFDWHHERDVRRRTRKRAMNPKRTEQRRPGSGWAVPGRPDAGDFRAKKGMP
jgi:hypothetical protein